MAEFGEIGGSAPPGAIQLAPAGESPHIVDQLIAERGQKLFRSRLFPVMKPLLFRVLRYREAVRMADDLAPLSGPAAMAYMSRLLSLKLEVEGLDNIPLKGGFVLAANHPTGIADGVAVYDALGRVRPDVAIFTNRDAIRINPRFADFLIPVEWRDEFRTHSKTRETLHLSSRAFREERAVVLFPSGRIAYWQNGRLNERPWQPSAVTLARRQGVPIIPVHVRARNSSLFYWFGNAGFTELRDMTVFHELLNKKGQTFGVRFGPLIPHDRLAGDPVEVTGRLQTHCVETLAANPDARF
jgi:putative hemolysin